MTERIGILGGTFDPIHCGHLIAADHVRDQLAFDYVLLIPARQSPLKTHHPGASGPDRLRMIERAIEGHRQFRVSAIELERTGQSYTVETLRAVAASGPSDLYFLMGYDQLRDLPKWREPDRIIELAQIVGMSRPEYPMPDLSVLTARSPAAESRIRLVSVPAVEISSSDLRRRLAEGRSISFRVPRGVEDYIQERGLYRKEKAGGG